MKKLIQLLLLWSLFISVPYSAWGAGSPPSERGEQIRVLLSSHSKQIELSVESPYSVYSESRHLLAKKARGQTLLFTQKKGDLYLGKKKLATSSVLVVPKQDGSLKFKGNRYRGVARVEINSKNKIALINQLKLEKYLKSVVAGEVAPLWPQETLKAQAVAARTYAYYHMVKGKDKSVDITSPLAQNYQGIKKEHRATNQAVRATSGQILYYRGYLFPAFFHSTCGGGTEFPQNVWSLDFKIPEVVPCDYCKDSPHFQWSKKFDLKEVEQKFIQAGHSVHGLLNIYPARISKNRSHVTEIGLLTSDGEKTFRTNEFRRILGFNEVKSAKFKVAKRGDSVLLNGWGWGHGVGMCQYGAKSLAKEETNYRKILSYYYPGCRLKRVQM